MNVTPADIAAEARAFLDAHAKPKAEVETRAVDVLRAATVFPEKSLAEDLEELRAARAWRQALFDAGLGWITGPVEYGGRGLTGAHQRAYDDVERDYDTPRQTLFGIALGMVAPTILAHGSPHAKHTYLRSLWRGDLNACQLFSEPGAGSDIAGLSTRAVHDGDEWVVTGQKVWTSVAHVADIGMVLTRTNPDAPKHKGLTMFLIDMKAPGVEVRPLRQMTGGASFNEVFLDGVRTPDTLRLGDVDAGWTVALTTLMNERMAGGEFNRMSSTDRLVALARHLGVDRDPAIRQRIAQVHIHHTVARLNAQRARAKLRAGQVPGPEMSIGKLAATENMRLVGDTVSAILGPRLVAEADADLFTWATYVLSTPGMRVAGGTDEIQRNIVGERVLGLPRDPS
ncbi:MAG: acyl-CoA dehydrogenase [Acidimicrobiia bacterium]|nr:MAG: acyl-CoA dehydrogenase [Acidimicrobiia bacterium]